MVASEPDGGPKTFDEIRSGELGTVASARGWDVTFASGPSVEAAPDLQDLVAKVGTKVQLRSRDAFDLGFVPSEIAAGTGYDFDTASAEASRSAPSTEPPAQPPPESATVGLALSGGGIRSATFSLGVLQLIAARGHLRSIDYVSSVSGGGYIASWLSAWIARTDIAHVEQELAMSPETCEREPAEVMWLRRYSNYLTPRVGALSLDALTVIATYLRNVLLNMIILVLGVAALLSIPIAALPLIAWLTRVPAACAAVGLGFALVSLSFVAINLTIKCSDPKGAAAAVFRSGGVLCFVVLPALAASLFGGIWLLHPPEHAYAWWRSMLMGLMAFYLVVGTAWLIALRFAARCRRRSAREGSAEDPSEDGLDRTATTFEDGFVYTVSAALAMLVGAALLAAFKAIFQKFWPAPALPISADWQASPLEAAAIFLFAPAGILVCLGISASIFIGLVGRRYSEGSREWFARTGGTFLMTSVVWIVWLGLAFYVPMLVDHGVGGIGSWLTNTAFATWLASLIGSMVLTRVRGQQKSNESSSLMTALAMVLATIVACGIFVLIAIGLHAVLGHLLAWVNDARLPNWGSFAAYSAPIRPAWPSLASLFAIGATIVALVFAWRVDINRFSLHDMYKNRLIRCYLGATNGNRRPHPFVGFDTNDDMPLTDLPERPHHIINTALNLVQGSELAWQERKAASFVFMRNYCGFQLSCAQGNKPVRQSAVPLPGMRPTKDYAAEDSDAQWKCMTLGTAMAISGAAVSPNMGLHSQPVLAALMTFFNLRLGRWCPNPAGCDWRKSSPSFGLRCLLAELTGHTNESSKFVYLSDGGHFENTGVYELVRRRCARILVVDVGADPARAFEDLANLLRKCRVDLGVDFELNASPLYGDEKSPRSKSGFVDGKIFYGVSGNQPAFEGRILVVKSSLQQPPVETIDIYSYAKRAGTFPQQTTVDQWFDESQFESYRKLGYSLAAAALDATAQTFFPTASVPLP